MPPSSRARTRALPTTTPSATLATWAIVAFFFRYASLASIVAAVFAPFYQLLIWDADATALAIAVMCLLLVWRHAGNITKLLAGTESKIGHKAGAAGVHKPDHHGKHPHAKGHKG